MLVLGIPVPQSSFLALRVNLSKQDIRIRREGVLTTGRSPESSISGVSSFTLGSSRGGETACFGCSLIGESISSSANASLSFVSAKSRGSSCSVSFITTKDKMFFVEDNIRPADLVHVRERQG